MAGGPLLSDLDLAALLCSRVCHDLISPVGALGNGLEVLEEEEDEELRKIAFDLLRRAAKQASAKLQFCRIAFGAAGSAGAHVDLGEAGDVATQFIGEEKVKLDWTAPRETRDKTEVKLLLNMMLLGVASIPRGGRVTVTAEGRQLAVRAVGEGARVPEKARMVLEGSAAAADLDARHVQAYYAMRLAEAAGFDLTVRHEGTEVVFAAAPRVRAAA